MPSKGRTQGASDASIGNIGLIVVIA